MADGNQNPVNPNTVADPTITAFQSAIERLTELSAVMANGMEAMENRMNGRLQEIRNMVIANLPTNAQGTSVPMSTPSGGMVGGDRSPVTSAQVVGGGPGSNPISNQIQSPSSYSNLVGADVFGAETVPNSSSTIGMGTGADSGRRQTFALTTGQPPVGTGAMLGAMPLATGQVLATQEKVDPKMQVHYATFKALIVAIDNQATHVQQFDQYRLLAFFVTMSVLKLIVDNEHRHNRNLDMTYATILRQSDDAFIAMFTSYIRVNHMATKEGFAQTILEAVGKLQALGSDPSRPMLIADYDKFFHAPVNKHLDTLSRVLDYAKCGALVTETQYWPKEVPAVKDDYNMVQLLHTTLGNYKENFSNAIGAEILKKMVKSEEWFRTIKALNQKLSLKAAALRSNESLIKPMVKLEEIERRVDNRHRAIVTKDGPRDPRLPMTPFTGAQKTQPAFRPNYGRYPVETSRGPPPNRNSKVEFEEEEINLLDDTANCDNPLLSPIGKHDESLDTEEQEVEHHQMEEWYRSDPAAFLDAMLHTQRTGGQTGQKLFDPKARPAASTPAGPCWKHFETKSCPGPPSCRFDHSLPAMQQLAHEKVKMVVNSPFVPVELLKTEMAKRESIGFKRNAPLHATTEVQEDHEGVLQDSPSRVAQIRDSSRDLSYHTPSHYQGST